MKHPKEYDYIESKSGAKGIVTEVCLNGVWIDTKDWKPYSDYGVSVGVSYESIVKHIIKNENENENE